MSLAVKLLCRARSRVTLAQGLCLARKSRHLLIPSTHVQTWRWFSSPTDNPPLAGRLEPWEYDDVDEANEHFENDERKPPSDAVKTTSASSLLPELLVEWGTPLSRRQVKKMRWPTSPPTALIRRPVRLPNRHAARRSLRKYRRSARRQAIHEHSRNTLGKPLNDWRTVLDFMIRHTPKYGRILDFRVVIGRITAAQARSTLSDLDTNLGVLQQRHKCQIRVEPWLPNSPLVLHFSGPNLSVRESLLDLVQFIGKVSAIRIHDPELAAMPVWAAEARKKPAKEGSPAIRILSDGEYAPEDEVINVYSQTDLDFLRMIERPKQQLYRLTTRADEIPPPETWTKSSFEEYVRKLVLGRIPTGLHKHLYPESEELDHQTAVTIILKHLFTSDELRGVVSVAALRIALRYIQAKGSVFRPVARALIRRAERYHMSMDADVFHDFLIGASRIGDLQSFSSVLKAMHSKGHYVRAEAWSAFLIMIQDFRIKTYIIKRMKLRGLHRLTPVLAEVGRQNVIISLTEDKDLAMNIQDFLTTQDLRYGPKWLNTITLNQMLDVLGGQGNFGACSELLDLIDRNRRVVPDNYTLNTMIMHTRAIPEKIALLARWKGLSPDTVTYQQFFKLAWAQRLPNMLRVIWRYAVFAGQTTSAMRHTITKLMNSGPDLSNRQAFLKEWEYVILGGLELGTCRRLNKFNDPPGAVQLMKVYFGDNGVSRWPKDELATKLQEAYEMDRKIHRLIREGTEVSPLMRELIVHIPLKIRARSQIDASHVANGEATNDPTYPDHIVIRRIVR
ncbi:hypothetical protein GGR50DRAFT_680239 [Xylaria sp. CBS 124048]|nr:hypothetical protein GGR50DRAFT_680239 [Xylaria sp. CBS 124048]